MTPLHAARLLVTTYARPVLTLLDRVAPMETPWEWL